MITTRTTTQAAEPAPRRDLIGHILLDGIEYTDARPWIGIVGTVLTIIAAGVFDQVTK